MSEKEKPQKFMLNMLYIYLIHEFDETTRVSNDEKQLGL